MKDIKIIIFDLDNTLVDFDACEKIALMYAFNLMNAAINLELINDNSKIDSKLWNTGTYNSVKVSKDKIPLKRFEILFSKYCIKYVNISKVNDLFMEGFSKAIYPYDASESILEYLTIKGYVIAVATNGLMKLQYPRILNSSLRKDITEIVASEEVGYNKPDSLIFNKILLDNNFSPMEAIIIGDSLSNDIQYAINAKIKSIWFNPKIEKIHSDEILPDYIISTLLELRDIL